MGKFVDLTGQKYGRLSVINRAPNKNGRVAWNCICDCGTKKVVTSHDLRSGNTKSCGCYFRDRTIETHRIDETGNKYGKLTVLYPAYSRNNNVWWHCKCDCGNETDVMAYALRSGHTRSCGCLKEQSYGSYLVEQYLIKHNIKYQKEYRFDNFYADTPNHIYRFDYGILDINNNLICLIEWDGKQHFPEGMSNRFTPDLIEQNQKRDEIKNKFCKDNSIKLLRIKYTEEANVDKILDNWFESAMKE